MNKGIKILSFVYFISSLSTGISQNIEFEHLTTEDGLSSNSCYCALQDKDGFMWFATEDGLDRWDGREFKIFRNNPDDSTSISSNKILWITEDAEGILWIGTTNGLNKFDKNTEHFRCYFFTDEKINQLHANTIGPIIEDGTKYLWIGTHLGLVYFNKINGNFKRFIPDTNNMSFSLTGYNTLSWITKGRQNELIIRSVAGLLKFHINSGKFEKILLPDNRHSNPRLMPIALTFNIYKNNNNNLWLQLNDGILYEYNIQAQKLTPLKKFYNITGLTFNDQIFSIEKDNRGFLWFGTLGKGLYCIDWKNGKFVNYMPDSRNKNSISSSWIYNIYFDKEGTLWGLSYNKGINKITIHKKRVIIYKHDPLDKKGLQDGDIMDVCEDDEGFLWIASLTGGVSKLNPRTGKFTRVPVTTIGSNGTSDNRISSLLKDRSGCIWIGTLGLNKYDPGKKSFTYFIHDQKDSTSISESWVISMFEDKEGYLWCGLKGNGLDRLDQKSNIFKHYSHNSGDPFSLSNNYVNDIYQDDKNTIWVGTEDGLCKFVNGKFIRFKHKKGNSESISGNFIYTIFEDSKKRLWIGTDRGLNLLNNETDKFSTFPAISILNENKIFGILEDNNSGLLMRTSLGLIQFDPWTKRFNLFNENDGLTNCRSIAFGFHAFLKSTAGKICYGGSESLMIFSPDSLEIHLNPPNVVLTKLAINYEPVKIGGGSPLKKAVNYSKDIILNYNQNILSLQFAALDYSEPEKIRYAYRMEGINDKWIYCGNQRIASYTSLEPGTYVFQVKASFNDRDWSKNIKSLFITISSPWWITWWFRSIVIVLFLSCLILLYKFRINHLKSEKTRHEEFSKKLIESQESERERIAGELHDGLGQNLMIIYNEIQQYSQREVIAPKELKNLFPEVKETIEEVREIARNLHPHTLEQLGLTKAVNSIIGKLSLSTEIDFHSDIEFIDEFLPSELWIHVYRIVQEALTNIIKHSDATEVKITIKRDLQNIFFLIEDNGIGIRSNTGKTKNGFGLENLKERARLLNARLEISSAPKKGVKLLLKIPIKDPHD